MHLPGVICSLKGGSQRVLGVVEAWGPWKQPAAVHVRREELAREMPGWLPMSPSFPSEGA